MSPAPTPIKRGGDDVSTPATFTETLPSTWASEVIEPVTVSAVSAVTTFSTTHTDYTVITSDGIVTAIPIATAASKSAGGSSSHIALAVALPISLVVACGFVIALYIHRFKSRREQKRRRTTWTQRLNWIPDSKVAPDDVDPSTSQTFNSTPLSPIRTVPASYPGHSRQDSAFA